VKHRGKKKSHAEAIFVRNLCLYCSAFAHYLSGCRERVTSGRAFYYSYGGPDNSSMNYQGMKKTKCDFAFFFIFIGLTASENGSTSLC